VNAVDRPRLVLHVGAPKTASTYIQRRLRANAERLRRHGIYVPVLREVAEMSGNAKLLPVVISRCPSLTFQRAFAKVDVHALEPATIVAELLRDWRPDSESVILSAENLRPIHAQRLRELLPGSVPTVVVLFVRRQDRWLDSYFNQMIKTNEIHEQIDLFLDRILSGDDERLCRPDWFTYYQAWRNAFGDCKVVFYDEVASDVFRAFFTVAGFDQMPQFIEVDRAQVSLDVYELAYLLDLRAPFDYANFLRHKSASEKASRRLGVHDNRSILSAANLARLREAFAESNERLLSELGRTAEQSPLQLDKARNPASYISLTELYASRRYRDYRKSADAIYARGKRRDRLKSLFTRSGQ